MSGEHITHGRHCICSACAAEDWTDPEIAFCGMHGPWCPREYQPLGRAGSYYFPEPPDGKRVYKWVYRVSGQITLTEQDAKDHMDSDEDTLLEKHWLAAVRFEMRDRDLGVIDIASCDLERER